ncbi:MAG: recombinase family protein [Ruminococcus sp.]|nr:recombinase family protein [Ruminococcus sp.]
MYGIYARQSVEKRDSISIEMQVDLCRKLLPEGEAVQIYEDKGFTGTNVNRPAFQALLKEIRRGSIAGVIVYKLDRISRSLSDFARLSEELEAHHVKLISYGERFDTSTPMGMMLVRMLILFAEMEQKTISARIRDNYYTRAERKKALGGVPPYGYHKDWSVNAEEAETVLSIFQQLIYGKSLDAIARDLSSRGIPSPRNQGWTGMQVGRMLRNAVYVKSDAAVYGYFLRDGAKMLHPAEDYCTGMGCVSIQGSEGKLIAAGTHPGIVQAEIWLAVQELLREKRPSCNGGSGSASWLQGIVICGKCGHSCYVRSNSCGSPYVYFVCRGKRLGICSGLKAMRTAPVENAVGQILSGEIQRILSENHAPCEELILESSRLDAEIETVVRLLREHPGSGEELGKRLDDLCQRRDALGLQVHRGQVSFQQFKSEMLKELLPEQKKALAQLFLKNVILTEEKITVFLR